MQRPLDEMQEVAELTRVAKRLKEKDKPSEWEICMYKALYNIITLTCSSDPSYILAWKTIFFLPWILTM